MLLSWLKKVCAICAAEKWILPREKANAKLAMLSRHKIAIRLNLEKTVECMSQCKSLTRDYATTGGQLHRFSACFGAAIAIISYFSTNDAAGCLPWATGFQKFTPEKVMMVQPVWRMAIEF